MIAVVRKRRLLIFVKFMVAVALMTFPLMFAQPVVAASKKATAMPVKGLEGVGINSLALWSAASRVTTPDTLIEHLKPVEKMGFSHVILIACADWIMKDLRCSKYHQTRDHIINSVKTLAENTNLHIVLALKPYKTKKEKGKNRSQLQKALETSLGVRKRFVEGWTEIANGLASVPRKRLSFSILNEPEFEFPRPSAKKLRLWEEIAKNTIKAIRVVSPDRVIIYEGIAKTSAFRRYKDGRGNRKYKGISSIIRPLPFKDIVYGFHYYQPHWFVQQHKNFAKGPYGRRYSSRVRKMVAADARLLAKWSNRNKVPAMLSEVGCVSYLNGKTQGPKTKNGCPNFARDLVTEFVKRGVSISWFGLEKEKTIYVRGPSDKDIWLPAIPVANKRLLSKLGLTAE